MKVLFLPDYPEREFYTIIPIFMRLGWFATSDAQSDFDFAVCWQDATHVKVPAELRLLAQAKPVLNLECLDISKQRVEAVFSSVFGRSTFVDPLSYSGRAVCKHDENALGGEVVNLPVATPEPGRVYQRLIDTESDGEMVELRVPLVLGEIPVVYEQRKDIPRDTIKTHKRSTTLRQPGQVFNSGEIEQLLAFCRAMGLDFGELDVLRCNEDGQLYVLDVNKTPGGFGVFNHARWQAEQRREAVEILADAMERGIRRHLARWR